MPRPPRIQFPGANYHIITRGDGRRHSFHDNRDYKRLTQGLQDVEEIIVATAPNSETWWMVRDASNPKASSSHRMVRLAAVVAGLGQLKYEWWVSPWLRGIDAASEEHGVSLELLGDHLARPTALSRLFGCCWAAANMRWLTGLGGLSVPDDLSVIVSDQHGELDNWFGGVRTTTIKLPLFETGKALASMARRLAEGRDVPDVTMLPCTLIEGDSVRTLNKETEG